MRNTNFWFACSMKSCSVPVKGDAHCGGGDSAPLVTQHLLGKVLLGGFAVKKTVKKKIFGAGLLGKISSCASNNASKIP